MTDKEERIYILSKPLYPSVDGWKDAKEKSMTRQEAIKKMAKCLCKFLSQGECIQSCKECNLKEAEKIFKEISPQHLSYFSQAEAALNALLGVEK